MVTKLEGRAGRNFVGLVVKGIYNISPHSVFRTAQSALHSLADLFTISTSLGYIHHATINAQ